MNFTPEEQAAQLRKPHGDGASAIFEYMNKGNKSMYPKVLENIQPEDENFILEIGQGNGILVAEIMKLANKIRYQGLDYSADSVAAATELNKELVNQNIAAFAEGLISEMPFGDGTFDRVVGVNTIYFWDDPGVELREIYRVLKKGGRVIFGYRPKDKLSQLPFTNYGFNHYHPEELEVLLKQAGFSETHSIRTPEKDREIDGKFYPMENVVTVATK